MKLLTRNKTFRSLFLSRVFNSMGAGMFAIAFLVYAAGYPHATFYLSLAAIIGVFPNFLGPITGYFADKTRNKKRALFLSSWLQTGLFLILALLIEQRSLLIFLLCCLVQLTDGLLASYKYALEMPIIQARVEQADTQEAFGLFQGLGSVFSLIEPPLGVALLALLGNSYSILGLINAATYFLSGLVLLESRRYLDIEFKPQTDDFHFDLGKIWRSMHDVFGMDGAGTGTAAIVTVIAVNFIMNGMIGLITLALKHFNTLGTSYAFAIAAFEVAFSLAMLLGSIFMKDGLQRLRLKPIIIMVLLAILGFGLTLTQLGWLALGFTAVIGYMAAKINPRFSAFMMETISADELGRIGNGIGTINSSASALGTIIFVGLANIISIPPTLYFLSLLSFITLLYYSLAGQTSGNSEKK